MKYYMLSVLVYLFVCQSAFKNETNKKPEGKAFDKLLPWKPGYLDIHHINTGAGDAAFFILPDGTSMLFDCGDMDAGNFNEKYKPLKASGLHPSDSLTAGQWIINYINQVFPEGSVPRIDYALISHFHSDHYGLVRPGVKPSNSGKYQLTGITEVGEYIPIKTLIDRNAPDYDYPVDLKTRYKENQTFQNYLKFIEYQSKTNGLKVEALKPGRSDQIILLNNAQKYPDFAVRNVKNNGSIWKGRGNDIFEYFSRDSVLNEKGNFNENPLSLAIKISYGKFDYFTGGDMTGLQGYGKPRWFDVETPVANVVGEVEVTTLNHHGNRDATNENFVKALAPAVIVQQSWCSDHPGQEVYERLISKSLYQGGRDIFATNIHDETKVTLGPWFTNAYRSMEGHIMIRVMPGGDEYYTFVLDDTLASLHVRDKFGPYKSR